MRGTSNQLKIEQMFGTKLGSLLITCYSMLLLKHSDKKEFSLYCAEDTHEFYSKLRFQNQGNNIFKSSHYQQPFPLNQSQQLNSLMADKGISSIIFCQRKINKLTYLKYIHSGFFSCLEF